MACMAAKLFMADLDSKNLRYSILSEEEGKDTIVRFGTKLDNTSISILFYFDDDNTNVHIVGAEFATIPNDKKDKMLSICNELNRKYRWMKFTIDDDGDISAECDAVIQLDSCADECFELLLRMTRIVDGAYPIIMKSLWA